MAHARAMFNIAHSRQLDNNAAHWVSEEPYPMTAKPSDQANSTRDLAKRARRLASSLTAAEDVARVLRYAEELEAATHDLEKCANNGAQR